MATALTDEEITEFARRVGLKISITLEPTTWGLPNKVWTFTMPSGHYFHLDALDQAVAWLWGYQSAIRQYKVVV